MPRHSRIPGWVVWPGWQGIALRVRWTFAGDFNPVMEIITLDERKELAWRCVSGHEPWQDGIFRFVLAMRDRHRQAVPGRLVIHAVHHADAC